MTQAVDPYADWRLEVSIYDERKMRQIFDKHLVTLRTAISLSQEFTTMNEEKMGDWMKPLEQVGGEAKLAGERNSSNCFSITLSRIR